MLLWAATRGISSSFPSGPKTKRFYQQNETTRKLLFHLLLAMEHILKKERYYSRLHNNIEAKSFLSERVKEAKKILKINDKSNPTKIFSYPTYMTYGKDIAFQCDTGRYGININSIAHSNFLSKYYDLEKLNDININLSGLLLPDLNLDIDNNNYLNLLTHEGYQLK